MGHEHVGRQHGAQIVAEVPLELEPEQFSVPGVGVDEPAHLVITDANDECGLRERVEHHADIACRR